MLDGDIADGDGAAVVVDAPEVLLDAVDALGVADIIINIHDHDGVVGIDVYLVGVVCGAVEAVAVDAADEALAIGLGLGAVVGGLNAIAFLLEVDFAPVLVLGVEDHGVVVVGVCAAHEGDAELVPVVGGLDGQRDVVVAIQTGVEDVGVVAAEGAVVIAVAGHDADGSGLAVLGCQGGYGTEGQRTVGVLDELVTDQCARPLGLVAVLLATYVDVLLMYGAALAEGTPAPDVAVGAVRGGLAGIEGTAVEHALLAVGGPAGAAVEAVLQIVPRRGHHVLDLAAPGCAERLAVDEIPVLAHLEDVRTLEHTVPDHVEHADVLPVLHVGRLELGKLGVATPYGIGRDDHAVEAIVGHENLRVAEVVGGIAVVGAVEGPKVVLGPGLEVGRRSTHDDLAVLAVAVVAGVVDVVEAVLLVIVAAAGTKSGVVLNSPVISITKGFLPTPLWPAALTIEATYSPTI